MRTQTGPKKGREGGHHWPRETEKHQVCMDAEKDTGCGGTGLAAGDRHNAFRGESRLRCDIWTPFPSARLRVFREIWDALLLGRRRTQRCNAKAQLSSCVACFVWRLRICGRRRARI